MITRAEPLTSQELPVSTQVLVWGRLLGGAEGCRGAAHLGYPVIHAHPGPPLAPATRSPPVPPRAELQIW